MNRGGGTRWLLGLAAVAVFFAVTGAPAQAQKRIVLTYDDAPRGDGLVFSGEDRASALIAGLRSVDAGPVAFFVSTDGFDTEPDGRARIQRYAAAGHFIANHSHSHRWAHRMPVEDYLADIDAADERLRGIENRRPWYRFPYLDEGRTPEKAAEIAAGLDARNLTNGYVTVDNYDWHVDRRLQEALRDGRPVDYEKLGRLYVRMMLYAAEFVDSVAVQSLGRSPVHVLLLHENDVAALYADDLVTAFRSAGWEVVSPEAAYDTPLPAPRTVHTGQGRVVALAIDAGRHRGTLWTWAMDEDMIDLELGRSGAIDMGVAPSAAP